MKVIVINNKFGGDHHNIITASCSLRYKVQRSIVSLGGEFGPDERSAIFLEHRLGQADVKGF